LFYAIDYDYAATPLRHCVCCHFERHASDAVAVNELPLLPFRHFRHYFRHYFAVTLAALYYELLSLRCRLRLCALP